jgi:7-keto-8-aminopelargonate synthetase-like enzyme
MFDDCHATGRLGEERRGTPALTGVGQRVDIVTGTLGKSRGGASAAFDQMVANLVIGEKLQCLASPLDRLS